ncbi:MAG: hypothetical protein KatS3mg011_2276 [Acidimicrobiia bacterium]|nr:MAG: hypothetical protein KatS3mg011_2276 [Acidimicrobiia bacterium]
MAQVLTLEEAEVQEHFFAAGWTDGLPVVPPTPERVAAMLEAGWVERDEVIGAVPQRNREVTAEMAAIQAVMAGCKPEYFPVVIAALQAMLDPGFNANAAVTSTGGAALCVVVSGPGAQALGLNSRHNALGPGNRANATIGRTLRLVALNLLDARVGKLDGSSLGHPGKYTFCFAEDPPPEPWTPLRVDLGFGEDDTTVTVLASEGPRQVANHLNENGRDICLTFAAAARTPSTYAVGKGHQAIAVFGPEHRQACIASGMSKADVRNLIYEESRIAPAELERWGVLLERGYQHDMTPDADGKLATIASPDDLFVVTAGGEGAGWSAYIPAWAPIQHSRATTRRVREPGDPLPACGPEGCHLPPEFFTRLEKG